MAASYSCHRGPVSQCEDLVMDCEHDERIDGCEHPDCPVRQLHSRGFETLERASRHARAMARSLKTARRGDDVAKKFVIFVYDPADRLPNPAAVENRSQTTDGIDVRVFVRHR